MPMTRRYAVNPIFEWRLRAALERVTPPWSPPRYQTGLAVARPWRLAPVLLAGAATVLLALTATAATGSPNPVVWTQRATTTIESVGHAPEASPSPEPSHEAPRSTSAAPPTHEAEHEASPNPEPSESPEALPRPEPTESPSPSDDH